METITFHLSGKKPQDIFLGDRIHNVKEIDFEVHLRLTKHDPQVVTAVFVCINIFYPMHSKSEHNEMKLIDWIDAVSIFIVNVPLSQNTQYLIKSISIIPYKILINIVIPLKA